MLVEKYILFLQRNLDGNRIEFSQLITVALLSGELTWRLGLSKYRK